MNNSYHKYLSAVAMFLQNNGNSPATNTKPFRHSPFPFQMPAYFPSRPHWFFFFRNLFWTRLGKSTPSVPSGRTGEGWKIQTQRPACLRSSTAAGGLHHPEILLSFWSWKALYVLLHIAYSSQRQEWVQQRFNAARHQREWRKCSEAGEICVKDHRRLSSNAFGQEICEENRGGIPGGDKNTSGAA